MTNAAPTPLHLWRSFRARLDQVCALFGLPSAIAQRVWLSRAEHVRIAGWLRPLEVLLRRLLYIDALKLTPAAPAPERKTHVRLGMAANTGAHFNIDDSESWRVCFTLGANPKRPHPIGKPANGNAPPRIGALSSAPLALRLEALIRGCANRETLAQRLANRLARAAPPAPTARAAPRPQTMRSFHRQPATAAQPARAARAKLHANDSS